MKKQNIINLVKFYVEKNDSAFRSEVSEIALDFEKNGETEISSYLMDLISTTNFYAPQNSYKDLYYLKKVNYMNSPLYLPEVIENDVIGFVRSINKKISISKVLFHGKPGSGKTQSAFQIARLLNRDILAVKMEDLIDSHLGQTSRNIVSLFEEIRHIPSHNVVILFDELDALVMNRVCSNDLREMGRVTSTFLREFEQIPSNIIVIATTNLKDSLDKAILRRFDANISFDRYTKEELIEISTMLLKSYLKLTETNKSDIRLFNKILKNLEIIPYPGDMQQIIKIALAFSDETEQYDYLRRLYLELNNHQMADIIQLTKEGYTTREIEILTKVPKSSVSRKLKGGV